MTDDVTPDASDDHEIGLSRRGFITKAARAGAILAVPGALGVSRAHASGFGGTAAVSDAEAAATTLSLGNYQGWIGKNELKWFKQKTGITVKQSVAQSNSSLGEVAKVAQNPDSWDLVLADLIAAGGIAAAGHTAPFRPKNMPNLRYVDPIYRRAYPRGIPTDFGLVGIAYRKDLVPERPASIADVWRLASKYSGRIVILDWDTNTIGAVLRYLGYSANSTDPKAIKKARDALIKIKKHVRAFTSVSDTARNLLGKTPTAVIALAYDWDAGAAQLKDKRIVFTPPREGMAGYMEGWIPIKSTKKLAAVEQLMNFHLSPRASADFMKVTGTASLEAAAAKLLPKRPPALNLKRSDYARAQFTKYTTPQAIHLMTRYFEEVKNA